MEAAGAAPGGARQSLRWQLDTGAARAARLCLDTEAAGAARDGGRWSGQGRLLLEQVDTEAAGAAQVGCCCSNLREGPREQLDTEAPACARHQLESLCDPNCALPQMLYNRSNIFSSMAKLSPRKMAKKSSIFVNFLGQYLKIILGRLCHG
jgi:hypothetical protein